MAFLRSWGEHPSHTHLEVLLGYKSQAVMAHEGEVDDEVQEREETMQPQELTPAGGGGGGGTQDSRGCRPPEPHSVAIPPSHHQYPQTSLPPPQHPRLAPTTTRLSMDAIQGGAKLLVGTFSPDPQRASVTATPHSTHGERRIRAVTSLPKGTRRGAIAAHPTPHRCPVG